MQSMIGTSSRIRTTRSAEV